LKQQAEEKEVETEAPTLGEGPGGLNVF
jgi:hypothetical protein